jgi:hypothetical protein
MLSRLLSLDRELGELAALPRSPVEPRDIIHTQANHTSDLGSVISPGFPFGAVVFKSPRFVRRGKPFHLEFGLRETLSPEEERAVLTSLERHIVAEVATSLATVVDSYTRLPLLYELAPPHVRVTFTIPEGTDSSAVVYIRASIAGVTEPPLCLAVVEGWAASLTLDTGGSYCTPALSTTEIFIPGRNELVKVYSNDGASLPSISLPPLHKSRKITAAAYCHRLNTLVFAGFDTNAGLVVALDASTNAVTWSIELSGVLGLAVLESHALVAATLSGSGSVELLRLSDGQRVATCGGLPYPINVAVDPCTEELVVSCSSSGVESLRWTGTQLIRSGPLTAVRRGTNHLLLTVVPAAADKRAAHVVVASYGSPQLTVVSLLSRECICTVDLSKSGASHVTGFTSDAAGTALVVVCGTMRTVVLPWPLDGMPPLV